MDVLVFERMLFPEGNMELTPQQKGFLRGLTSENPRLALGAMKGSGKTYLLSVAIAHHIVTLPRQHDKYGIAIVTPGRFDSSIGDVLQRLKELNLISAIENNGIANKLIKRNDGTFIELVGYRELLEFDRRTDGRKFAAAFVEDNTMPRVGDVKFYRHVLNRIEL